jgi:hypothetical protein
MTEAQLSQKIIKYMLGNGVLAVKMSDRFHAGIPDIYYGKGNWIEVKLIERQSDYFHPGRLFKPDQRRWMQKLSDNGNTASVLVGVQFDNELLYWGKSFEYLMSIGIKKQFYSDCDTNLAVCLSRFPE